MTTLVAWLVAVPLGRMLMTLLEAWQKSNGVAYYQYFDQRITVICGKTSDTLDVQVGNGPIKELSPEDFGDLLYLLSLTAEEGWQHA